MTENGSFRNIVHKRSGNVINRIDLYDVFVAGDLSKMLQLRSGDSIVVEQIQSEVQISGGVSNPGKYEILSNETLKIFYHFQGIEPIITHHQI